MDRIRLRDYDLARQKPTRPYSPEEHLVTLETLPLNNFKVKLQVTVGRSFFNVVQHLYLEVREPDQPFEQFQVCWHVVVFLTTSSDSFNSTESCRIQSFIGFLLASS